MISSLNNAFNYFSYQFLKVASTALEITLKAAHFVETRYVKGFFKEVKSHKEIIDQQTDNEVYYRINFSKRTFYIIPHIERVFFIASEKTIRKILSEKREGDLLAFGFSSQIQKLTGSENMLICPYSEHRRLRTPFEKSFAMKQIKKESVRQIAEIVFQLAPKLAKLRSDEFLRIVSHMSISSSIMGIHLSNYGIDSTKRNNNKELSEFEYFSSYYCFIEMNYKPLKELIQKIYSDEKYLYYRMLHTLDKLKDEGHISQEEQFSSIIAVFAAGTHSSSEFMKCFFYELHRHPEQRELILKEWNEFCKNYHVSLENENHLFAALSLFISGGEINGHVYEGSQTLEWCFLETLRLHPIFIDLFRKVKQSFSLNNEHLKTGEEIHLNIKSCQTSEREWEEPMVFKPERFMDAELKKKLLAFSTGIQSCIGKHFIQLEACTLMTFFILFYEWAPFDQQPKEFNTGFIVELREYNWKNYLVIKDSKWKNYLA